MGLTTTQSSKADYDKGIIKMESMSVETNSDGSQEEEENSDKRKKW